MSDYGFMIAVWNKIECERRRWQRDMLNVSIHSAPYAYQVTKGRVKVRIASEAFTLRPGEIFWHPTAIEANLTATSAFADCYIWRFRRSGFARHLPPDGQLLTALDQLNHLVRHRGYKLRLRPATQQQILDLSERTFDAWLRREADDAMAVKAYGFLFFDTLRQDALHQKEHALSPGLLVDERFSALIDWIDAHLDTGLAIDDLAQRVDLKRSRFCQLFRKQTGRTPQQYIRRQRVAKACQLLRDTDNDVTWIGFEAGFGSLARFHAAFVEFMGISPNRWRKQQHV